MPGALLGPLAATPRVPWALGSHAQAVGLAWLLPDSPPGLGCFCSHVCLRPESVHLSPDARLGLEEPHVGLHSPLTQDSPQHTRLHQCRLSLILPLNWGLGPPAHHPPTHTGDATQCRAEEAPPGWPLATLHPSVQHVAAPLVTGANRHTHDGFEGVQRSVKKLVHTREP